MEKQENSSNGLVNDSVVQLYVNEFRLSHITECQKILFSTFEIKKNYLLAVGEAEGKILSYGLPLLQSIDVTFDGVQAIIFAKDRQEVMRIFYILKPYARAMGIDLLIINNGVSIADQIVRLRRKVHIVIATQSRLLEHIERKTCDLSLTKICVIDRMDLCLSNLDSTALLACLKALPEQTIYWVYSAACDNQAVDFFMKNHISEYQKINIANSLIDIPDIHYFYVPTNQYNKLSMIFFVLESIPLESIVGLVVSNTISISGLVQFLITQGFFAIDGNDKNRNISNQKNYASKDKNSSSLIILTPSSFAFLFLEEAEAESLLIR